VAVVVREEKVAPEPAAARARRRRLLTRESVPGTRVLLERLALEAGASVRLEVARGELAWFLVLEGSAVLDSGTARERLTDAHVVCLPPGFEGSLATNAGTGVLYAAVPEAARFDPGLEREPPRLRVVDWTREPVLASRHDARSRIYVATPRLFGTRALKGEMILYPPGTEAPSHHHEGAEHFMYVTRGRGTAYAGGEPFGLRRGDLIYYRDREPHHLKSDCGEELVFVEFFVPGEYRTVWAPGAAVCTWTPTGRDIRGRKPAREIAEHSSAPVESPRDV
jgi:quercetin dioxygenase-like cupin family protein